MSTLVGSNAYVTVSGTTIVAAMAEWAISDSRPAVVVEKFSETYSTVPGMSQRTVTGSVAGYCDPADITGQTILYNNYIAGTAVPGFRLYLDSSNYYYNTGGIYIENYNTSVSVGDIIAVDFTFVASGDWVLTTGAAPVQGDSLTTAIIHDSSNNRVARYDGTSEIQGSLVTIDDSGNLSTAGNITGTYLYGNGSNITDLEETAQDAVGTIMFGGGGTSVVYDDVANTITISGATASGVIADHGALNGLADDDHPQYLKHIEEDTSPTLGEDLDTGNYSIQWDTSPSSDHTAHGDISVETIDVNATGFGATLYMAADGHFEEADASASSTLPCIALALETGTGSKKVLWDGWIRDDSWSWTRGQRVYLSETTGDITQTVPTTSGVFVQTLGIAVATNIVKFRPTYEEIRVTYI